jgi:hypothetical protein
VFYPCQDLSGLSALHVFIGSSSIAEYLERLSCPPPAWPNHEGIALRHSAQEMYSKSSSGGLREARPQLVTPPTPGYERRMGPVPFVVRGGLRAAPRTTPCEVVVHITEVALELTAEQLDRVSRS